MVGAEHAGEQGGWEGGARGARVLARRGSEGRVCTTRGAGECGRAWCTHRAGSEAAGTNGASKGGKAGLLAAEVQPA